MPKKKLLAKEIEVYLAKRAQNLFAAESGKAGRARELLKEIDSKAPLIGEALRASSSFLRWALKATVVIPLVLSVPAIAREWKAGNHDAAYREILRNNIIFALFELGVTVPGERIERYMNKAEIIKKVDAAEKGIEGEFKDEVMTASGRTFKFNKRERFYGTNGTPGEVHNRLVQEIVAMYMADLEEEQQQNP